MRSIAAEETVNHANSLGFQPRPGQRQLMKFTFFKVAPDWRSSAYTQTDTPIFTCIACTAEGLPRPQVSSRDTVLT